MKPLTHPLFALASLVSLIACSSSASTDSASPNATANPAADGGAAESGAASYPAFTPALPQLAAGAGKVLAAPKFQLLHYASDTGAGVADTMLSRIGATDYWSAATKEYGVGPATSLPAATLTSAAPATVDDADVRTWLKQKLDAQDPVLAVPDDDTAYVFVLPPTTKVTRKGAALCGLIGGYHDELTLANGRGVAYVVVPQCASFLGMKGSDALTFILSHELVETSTDPYPATAKSNTLGERDVVWQAMWGGEEAGDLCALTENAVRLPDLDLLVQRTWSNAAARAGHAPCVPAAGAVGFGAAPVLPDGAIYGTSKVAMVALAVGASRTIDVQLFSEAPTADFTVAALDLASAESKTTTPELALTFEGGAKTFVGHNGDVAKLTVTALRTGSQPGGTSLFMIAATSSDKKAIAVWPGLAGPPK
jgi:hypothetical protein